MIRVADYIADYIYKLGVKKVFMFVGGGMMFLSDGVAKHPNLKSVHLHHEQALAMAAISYAKYNGDLGVVYVTTGCGSTNTITGLLDAWQDNVASLFISGQSKRKETIGNSEAKLRQFGVQEVDIISIIQTITKYSVMINDPLMIAYHLEKSIYLARSGRPGPVWLDIPLDVQGALVDEKSLIHFDPEEIEKDYKEIPNKEEMGGIIQCLKQAERPIIIAGQGIRLAGAIDYFKSFVEQNNIPFVVSRLGIDVLPSDHPLYIGRIGNKGDRAGNFAVQNADLVIAIGSRLSVSSTGHEYQNFAREAKLIVADIDPEEHKKNTVKIDLFINADAGHLLKRLCGLNISDFSQWANICNGWKREWPVCLPEYRNKKGAVNLYHFVDCLSKKMKPNSVVVSDAGSAFYVASQGIQLQEGQRYITSGGQAEMGYTLPACIGISFAQDHNDVIGINGDGSFQLNIQELQTIKHYGLPVKIFVWNNDGYLSIRATQSKFCEKRFIGTDNTCGISFPDLEKIVNAYGLKYVKIKDNISLDAGIDEVLSYPDAVICEVICIRDQEIVPTISSFKKVDGTMASRPSEDMYPFLGRKEFHDKMIVEPIVEK